VVGDSVFADLEDDSESGCFGSGGDSFGVFQGDDVERAYAPTSFQGLIHECAGLDERHGESLSMAPTVWVGVLGRCGRRGRSGS
jgi:hypothetical protein